VVLRGILATEISPELVPGDSARGPAPCTEDMIGPYELQDFHIYYLTRYGFRPSKIAFLCQHAWGDAARGSWRGDIAESERRAYALATIKKWLRVLLLRFFQTSQFKRSAMPNGPKVGSGGSLSPRGDWRAPSDAVATVWLQELDRNVPDA
jgi:NAD+ synthase (glutamine-hydrolysing)